MEMCSCYVPSSKLRSLKRELKHWFIISPTVLFKHKFSCFFIIAIAKCTRITSKKYQICIICNKIPVPLYYNMYIMYNLLKVNLVHWFSFSRSLLVKLSRFKISSSLSLLPSWPASSGTWKKYYTVKFQK